jgi:DNA-binding NarL/FixJ family response regulator
MNKELTSDVKQLLDGTRTYRSVAIELNTTEYRVRKIAKENGLKSSGERFPRKTKRNNEILTLLRQGKKYRVIGERYGITRQRVYEIASTNGIKRNNMSKNGNLG